MVASGGLDFDGDPAHAALEHEVDLRASGSAPVKGMRARMPELFALHDVFDDERLPARAADGVRLQVLLPGIAQVELGGLREPLADVAKIRTQRPEQKSLLEHPEIALHGVIGQAERRAKLRGVQDAALPV